MPSDIVTAIKTALSQSFKCFLIDLPGSLILVFLTIIVSCPDSLSISNTLYTNLALAYSSTCFSHSSRSFITFSSGLELPYPRYLITSSLSISDNSKSVLTSSITIHSPFQSMIIIFFYVFSFFLSRMLFLC